MNKVLVVATGRKTRGGITSVIKIHESMSFWKEYNCEWLETHFDGNKLSKISMFLVAYIKFTYKVFSFQLIHFHLSWPLSALRKLPFILVAKLFNKKIIVHIHASAETTYLKHRFLYNLIFALATKIVYIYPSFFKESEHQYIYKSILVFNPILDSGHVDLIKKKNQIVFLGSLTEKKGVFDLINAFEQVSKKYQQWSLKIAGVGNIEKCEDLIDKLHLKSKIKLLGWVKGDAKQKLLKESKIFCLPSYSEGFPMSLIEAWQNKLLPVVSNVGGVSDVLIDNKNGFLIEPGNIHQLAEKLEIAINDNELYGSILREGEKVYQENFEIQKLDSIISNLYSSLV